MILSWFLASVAAIVAGSILLPTPDLLSGYVQDMTLSYLYIALCAVGFVAGYMLFPGSRRERQERTILISPDIPARYVMLFAALAISGVAILLLQIQATVGLSSYTSLVFDAATGDSMSKLRYATIVLPSSEGGYPGYIKMFNWNSVIAPFCLLALIARGYRLRGFVSFALGIVIATMFLGGIFLRMDRLAALALAPVLLNIICAPRERLRKLLAAVAVVLLLAAMAVQSARRETDMGMLEWAASYLQLGTINLTLLMRSQINHTYGLIGIFSPVAWIAKSFGISLLPDTSAFDWSSNPAQNGFGFMFLDFGWLAVPAMLIAGSVARRIDERVRCAGEGPWRELQWIAAYAVASLPVVPAYNGIEFWLQLVMSVMLVRSVINFVTRRQPFKRRYSSPRSPVAIHASGLPV